MQAAEYIVVKNTLGKPRAYLSPEPDGIKDCYIDQRLNGESKLEFYIPAKSEKVVELTPECRIIADGREFTILKPNAVDVERSQDGKLWGKVMAEESWALMDKRDVTVSNDPQTPIPADLQVCILSGGASTGGYPQGSAGSALSYLLQDDPEWTLGTVDIDGSHDLETEKLSRLQNIEKVQKIWGGNLVWEYVLDEADNVTARILHLRDEAKWQNYNGFEVRYKKNLKSITRTNNHDIVTKLYPFGQDDLDISSVNGGKKCLTNFTYTSNEYVGLFTNQEISDPQELKEKATEALEKMCKPRRTYRTGLVDLRTLPEFSHEEFVLGDMADVVDPDVGTDRIRIQRYKRNVFEKRICELEIGEPEERLAAQLASSFDAAKFVKEALRPNPSISNLLKSFVNTFTTAINGASGNYTMIDGVSTWWDVDGEGNRTGKIVRITPGGIGLSKNAGQTFQQAVTGDGILASAVICSVLYALSSGDGYTKLIDDGLHVYDDDNVDRVHVGKWYEDDVKKFGLKVQSGSLVIGGGLSEGQINPTSTSKWNNAIGKGVSYNGVVIDDINGVAVTSNNGITDMLNATEGITIGKRNAANTDWLEKYLYADTEGKLNLDSIVARGQIDCTSLKINGVNALTTGSKISASSIEDLVVGGNVTMGENATIGWANITGAENVIEKTETNYTYLQSNKIYSPIIEGGTIISDTDINITKDARIGHKLILSSSTFTGGIQWGEGDTTPYIYYDPAGSTITIGGTVNGIYAKGQRIDIPSGGGCLIEDGDGYSLDNGSTRPTLGEYAVDLSYMNTIYQGVTGDYAFGAGYKVKAPGMYAISLGYCANASGYASCSLGNSNADGDYSHANNHGFAFANYSCAENYGVAMGEASHAEGGSGTMGAYSHGEGYHASAEGDYSHAQNYHTKALGDAQTAIGKYNVSDIVSAFIIGNGDSSTKNNAFTVSWDGDTYTEGSYSSGGADHAENCEWLDGNEDNEDRVGYFVTLDGEKIKKANSSDDYILGITSVNPTVLGDNPACWQGKYLKDEWGRVQYQTVLRDVETHSVEGEEDALKEQIEVQERILNPDYDPTLEYKNRTDRQEWEKVGVMGKLLVRDDGSCVVNGYCKPNDDGVATISDSGYRVMKRIADNIILVMFR